MSGWYLRLNFRYNFPTSSKDEPGGMLRRTSAFSNSFASLCWSISTDLALSFAGTKCPTGVSASSFLICAVSSPRLSTSPSIWPSLVAAGAAPGAGAAVLIHGSHRLLNSCSKASPTSLPCFFLRFSATKSALSRLPLRFPSCHVPSTISLKIALATPFATSSVIFSFGTNFFFFGASSSSSSISQVAG